VTDPQRLSAAIGADAATHATNLVRAAGQALVEGAAADLLALTRSALNADSEIAGVVLLGGYTVVPSERVRTLPPKLADLRMGELDGFWVWSDDGYGRREGDLKAGTPVSRIPDGGSAKLLNRMLGHGGVAPPARSAGVRNLARPFAEEVFAVLPNGRTIHVCAPLPGGGLPPFALDGDLLYVMLHGDYRDQTTFTGEDLETGESPLAVSIDHLPMPCASVVFAGCCWGALTVGERAVEADDGVPLTPLTVDSSIALRCLLNGANAFVGCTGAHYSPDWPDLDNYGGPMHRHFWSEILSGSPPARALHSAKTRYESRIPHNPDASRGEEALEHKILRQFTCLGLGW
jgi:hypothetical protein